MLYPLKFKPLYKDYIWGGRNLASLGKILPADGIVAESWEVACHKNGSSIIANGDYEGISLPELVKQLGRRLVGTSLQQRDVDKFPLLIKLIDAEKDLSVQVHPDDKFAFAQENGENGKNEMWYIISAKPGARLVHGILPGVTRERFAEAIAENNVESCLRTVSVAEGDVINIPAGTIHAIGKGIILAEVQQNSDTTYRVYDYGRTGRELHIEKALQVINFEPAENCKKYEGIVLPLDGGCSKRIVQANRFFCTEIYNITGSIRETADGSKFAVYIFISGSGIIRWKNAKHHGSLPVGLGESILIPADMGEYTISGSLTALKTYVPDLGEDVVKPLKKAGKSISQIFSDIKVIDSSL